MNTLLQIREPYTEPVTLPVVCRPDQSYWVLVIFLGAVFCLFCSTLGPSMAWMPFIIFALVMLAGPLALAFWMARAVIIADEQGLRWRGMGRWHRSEWAEVRDYYLKVKPGQANLINTVVCETGYLSFSKGVWNRKGCQWLQSAIAAYATDAGTTEWKVLGTRPELDWPRTFRYDTGQNRWIVHQASLYLTLITVLLFFPWHSAAGTSWWKAVSLTSVAGSIAWLAFKLWLISKVKQAAHRRFDEQITVTLERVIWENRNGSVAATWDEITDYFDVSSDIGLISRIVTPEGNIDFHASLQDFHLLKEFIVQQTDQIEMQPWRILRYTTALGGAAAKWSSGREGIGDRIYHYRTILNRVLLRVVIIFALVPIILFALVGAALTGTDRVAVLVIDLSLCLGMFWICYRFWTASVRTNPNGITQYMPFGKKYIAWDDVVRFYKSGETPREDYLYGNVIGPNIRIQFWNVIADVEELKEEISLRAVHATGDWQGQEIRNDTDIRAISGYRE